MGLQRTERLLRLEQADFLDNFESPGVDVYSFYGKGIPTITGWSYPKTKGKPDVVFTPELFGEDLCPADEKIQPTLVGDPEDYGDGVGPLRSTRRAESWAAEHKAKGLVLEVKGYQSMGHTPCTGGSAKCHKDYTCVINALKEGTSTAAC